MKWYRKIFKQVKHIPVVIDPLMGKTVIRFTTHGCMGTEDKFDFIGKIVDVVLKEDGVRFENEIFIKHHKFYKVEVLKNNNGEKRDGNLQREHELVPSWYLQDIGGDFLICYD